MPVKKCLLTSGGKDPTEIPPDGGALLQASDNSTGTTMCPGVILGSVT